MLEHSKVHINDYVEISLSSNSTKHSTDHVFKILCTDNSNTIVILKNGDKGKVIQILNSVELISKRIMNEDQYTENKEKFDEAVMREKVIPQTIQSFLNSEGGYLYIGVKDTGTLEERLVGLRHDFKLIEQNYKEISNDKLCDELERKIITSIDKHLSSKAPIGPLIELNFISIKGTQIVEMVIKKSSHPWFYKNLVKNNKSKKFIIMFKNEIEGERSIDDFYIRRGGSKKLIETHSEVYDYVLHHFRN